MRRALTLLTALVLGGASPGAQATYVPLLTLTQQAKRADVIVRATLGPPTRVKEGEVTWLVYPLTVVETIAGDPASLPQLEGKPALYMLAGVEDLPELRAGQEAFWLLYSRRMDSPIVGFSQGVYPIENGRVTRLGETANTAPDPAAGTNTAGSATPTTPADAAATPPAAGASATPGASSPTLPAGTAPPPAPSATDPNAIERDPARFRDALRAARGAQ
ncbi:hypothetical protein [Deinococcus sp. YIM 77859]|uniref:hypothetical protein n=1 Tax=Deinococcus sp. YIM 77859 TaxID=1540221 RepID=UPI0005532825|nr:hypothetical protein [Deinococcus sp. YIM 77859]